jgi:hypothetical protein
MRIGRLLTAVTVVALPLGLVVISAGPASASSAKPAKAAKAATGTGIVTCGIGGDATFTPPLTADGTPGFAHEVVQFDLFAVNCTGGSPSPTSATIVSKAIKVKDVKVDGTKVAGACYVAPFDPGMVLKNKITWSPAGVKPSHVKLTLTPLTNPGGTLTGYSGTGTTKGSYAGPSTATLNVGALVDLIALQDACTQGDVSTSVPELAFGPGASLTLG